MNEFLPIYFPALLIGAALVAMFAFWDFHLPYHPQKLRYAVSFRRYVLAAAIYIGVSVVLFLLVTGILQPLLLAIQHQNGVLGAEKSEPQGVRQTSLMLSALLVVVFPHLPGLRGVFKGVRRFSHEIALYPKSVQLLTAIMAATPCKPGPEVSDQVEESMARYSVPRGRLEAILSRGALRQLKEACFLQSRFAEISRVPSFSGFCAARAAVMGKLEVELQKRLRRTAKALLSLDPNEPRQSRVVSQFVAEDCEVIVSEYRTLLAEAAISCVPGPAGRETLIGSFRYKYRSLSRFLIYLSWWRSVWTLHYSCGH